MRTFVAVLLVGTTAAVTASASVQTSDPANPAAPGPVSPSITAAFPPANAGCGEDGLTRSPNRPTVRLTSATFPVRAGGRGASSTGRVRIPVRANQVAATKVKIAQVGGKRVGGTAGGSYTCTEPTKRTVSVALEAHGVKLVRRHRRLVVKVTFRLINGSGVTHTRVWSGVIRPE